jgi:hypothetical protein
MPFDLSEEQKGILLNYERNQEYVLEQPLPPKGSSAPEGSGRATRNV